MKSEHRRELHANELEKLTETIGKFFERNGSKVLMGLVAAIAVGIGAYYAFRWGGNTAESASDQVFKAEATSDLLAVADNTDYSKLPLQIYVRLAVAERQLSEAGPLYITTKKGGLADLNDAKKNFETVLNAKGLTSDARERALRGLAACLESMSGRDTSPAVKAYENYLKEFPDTKWKKLVEERIAALKTDRAKELYAFLSTGNRKPTDRKLPKDIKTEDFRKIRGHENVFPGGESPVELPPIPDRLRRDLDLEGGAKPFPTNPPTVDGKKKPGKSSGPAFPENAPSKPKTGKAKPFRAPDSKPGTKKGTAKKTSAPK